MSIGPGGPPPPLPRASIPPSQFPSPLPGKLILPPSLSGLMAILGTFTHSGAWPSADQAFTVQGGVVIVAWSISAFVTVAGTQVTCQFIVDGGSVDAFNLFINPASTHTPSSTRFAVFAAPQLNIPGALAPLASGKHQHHLGIQGANTSSDANDHGYVLILDLLPG